MSGLVCFSCKLIRFSFLLLPYFFMINNLKFKVEKAIEIIKNASNQLSELELFDVFVESDIFKGDDYYFFVFVPLIITRLAYPEVHYSDEYYEYFDGVTRLGVFKNNH